MDGTEVAPSVVCWFQQCSEGIEQHVHLPTQCEAQMNSIDARGLLRSNCPSSFEFLSQLSDTLDGDGESEDEVSWDLGGAVVRIPGKGKFLVCRLTTISHSLEAARSLH